MRHRSVLATVTVAALALMAPAAAFAQAPAAPPPPPAQDFSKVEIKTTKLSGNFYTLEGSGGMIGVQSEALGMPSPSRSRPRLLPPLEDEWFPLSPALPRRLRLRFQ